MYGVLIFWFVLTFLSLLFVIYDQLTNTPSVNVMKFAWFLVILYTGPIGLFFYFLSCRQPMEGTHDEFIKPHWKQALGSEIHCVAGDATAIIVMAAILHSFSISNGLEALIEYIAAYLFGLFIFQALFMRSMFSSYAMAVKHTIFSETVSMNYVMAGMIPTIIILKHFFPQGANPTTALFWGIMSLATIIGFILAYPVNSYLVKHKLKHGMMSKGMKMGKMKTISKKKKRMLTVSSFAFLFVVAAIVNAYIPITF